MNTQDTTSNIVAVEIKFFVTHDDGVQREINLLQYASGKGKVSAVIRNENIGEIKLHRLRYWQD